MITILPTTLSDHDLLMETAHAAATERRSTASLVALLAEVDARRLYLGEGFSSLFRYATERLRLSEPAAYSRITAARLSRRFPVVLSGLDEGAISLSTVGLLAGHLTEENHEALLDAARHKSKREVERLVAAIHPQPDIASSVRALPARRIPPAPAQAVAAPPVSEVPGAPLFGSATVILEARPRPEPSMNVAAERPTQCQSAAHLPAPLPEQAYHRALVAPLAPRRYLIRMTVSEETQQKLAR